MTIELEIKGMSCGHCVRAVKDALEQVRGVESADVNLEEGRASVVASEETESGVLIAAVQEEGYEARLA